MDIRPAGKLQGCTLLCAPGFVNVRRKAGEHNFFISYSRNPQCTPVFADHLLCPFPFPHPNTDKRAMVL